MGLPRPGRVLVAEGELAARVAELGRAIARDYARANPVLVGVLQGAIPFFADLMRRLPIDLTVDFVRASSYGAGTTTSGTVRLVVDLTVDISDRDVLIVDDIVDTGLTLAALKRTFEARGAPHVSHVLVLRQGQRRPGGRRDRLCRLLDPQRVRGGLRPGLRRALPQPAPRRRARRLLTRRSVGWHRCIMAGRACTRSIRTS